MKKGVTESKRGLQKRVESIETKIERVERKGLKGLKGGLD